MTIIEACHDHNLLRPLFRNLESWATWFVVLKAIFGLPLTELELRVFTELTARTVAPTAPAQECWLIMGRRAGKSFIVSLIAVYLAAFRDYHPYLAPGERATVITYIHGPRPGIYRFSAGRLTSIERAPEAPGAKAAPKSKSKKAARS